MRPDPHSADAASRARLLSPLILRGVTARNRIMISPMCQYAAVDGMASDYHMVHLGKYAVGGAGIIMAEATAISEVGRISPWDLCLYDDRQVAPLKPIVSFTESRGAVPGVQLCHAGRKASGRSGSAGGAPLDESDAGKGHAPWQTIAPSAVAADGWPLPREMTRAEIAATIDQWAAAARRAIAAGFRIVEVHAAHGYLVHQFLSPVSNRRTDDYGGSTVKRMRYALEVAEAIRAAMPEDLPLFFRISVLDGDDYGWTVEDSVRLATALKGAGVDVVDCSSGGMLSPAPTRAIPRGYGFQVPFSEAVRLGAGIPTVAVGLIVTPSQAETILRQGKADIIGIGREALENPHWALRAYRELGGGFEDWPAEYRSWMERRDAVMAGLDRSEVESAARG